ncbi:MAG: fluoride efflux transporter CrcB [Erythrobacter sp.]
MFLNTLFAASSPLAASALVASGGAIGALGRYQLGRLVIRLMGDEAARGFPWATFIVNLVGCLVMGLLFGWFIRQGATNEGMRLLLGVGVLGGFTTFSTFSLELLVLLQRGSFYSALLFAGGSLLAGLAAVFIGVAVMRGAA